MARRQHRAAAQLAKLRRPARHAQPAGRPRPRLRRLLERAIGPASCATPQTSRPGDRVRVTLAKGELDCEVRSSVDHHKGHRGHQGQARKRISFVSFVSFVVNSESAHDRHLHQGLRSARSPSSSRSSRSSKRATSPLEQSLALYERGVQLSRFCHARLEEAERRIEILNERGELKPAPATFADEPARD